MYEALAREPHASRVNWSRVQIVWGDERCVPPGDPESNYRMARETLLDRVPVPATNVHPIPEGMSFEEPKTRRSRRAVALPGGVRTSLRPPGV